MISDNNHINTEGTYLNLDEIVKNIKILKMYKEMLYSPYTDKLRGISAYNMNI